MTSVAMLASLRPNDAVIAVMGATGTGKSTFINLLTKNGHKTESGTIDVTVSRYDIDNDNRSVFLVETPGFDYSRDGVTDTDILEKIVDFLQPKGGVGRTLNGIIYMHRISDPRFGGMSKKNLRMVCKLCGNDQLQNVRIVTTFWSEVDKKKAAARETELATTAFKLLIESGAILRRHDDTAKSARSIMSELIIKKPVMMQIQQELNEGKKLGDTSAGVVIIEEIVQLQQKYKKEMASLIKEMEEAAKAKDEALRAELGEERRELERKMARADYDRRRWEKTFEARADLEAEASKSDEMRYDFVETKSNWSIGSCHHSLCFSSDGTTIAGTMAVNSPNNANGRVQFWDTATGAATSSFNDWSFVVFSPTDPDTATIVGSNGIQLTKRDSPGGKTWSVYGRAEAFFTAPTIPAFRSDGEKITVSGNDGCLYEYDPIGFVDYLRYTENSDFKASSIAYCPFELDSLVVGRNNGQLIVLSHKDAGASKFHCQLSPTGTVKVSVCIWSQDGKWIATGDDAGDVRLWNAGVTTNVSLARLLPHGRSGPITSLIFVPGSTALMIISGGYLAVWDIAKGEYVANSGLPAKAKNIALDGPRNRVAVVVNDRVSLYELKISRKKRPMKRKPSIPSELAEIDITSRVVKSKPDPFVGFYFDIYRGAWKLETPRIFQHAVAIKALRPGFNPRSKVQNRQDFEDLLTKRLTAWSNLAHDNLVPLLGISMDFGRFPAMVTSWMMNGLLSEYIKSDEEYDKMELVVGVAKGVAYLHSKRIVHSDIRASSVLVDELGNARLGDPGLLSVLDNSPLISSGTMTVPYRWMAPELMKNSSAKADYATDVYSVTMTSLEIFTASDPFEGVSDALVPGQVIQNRRPDRPDDVQDGLWALWDRGWNQDPTKRPDMASYVGRLHQLVY